MMIHKFRYSLIAVAWGIFQGVCLQRIEGGIPLEEILLWLSYGELYCIPAYLLEMGLMMVPYILFQIFFGTYIYRHYCSASVYFFSRQTRKKRWFLKEAAKMYAHSWIFVALILLFTVVAAGLKSGLIFRQEQISLLFCYLIIHSMWLFLLSLAINLLSIQFGNNVGFIIVVAVQFAMITMLMLFYDVLNFETTRWIRVAEWVLKFNPVSSLVLKWHTCSNSEVDAWIHMLPVSFPFRFSIIYFLLIAIGIICVGAAYVKRKEIIVSDMEQEGF